MKHWFQLLPGPVEDTKVSLELMLEQSPAEGREPHMPGGRGLGGGEGQSVAVLFPAWMPLCLASAHTSILASTASGALGGLCSALFQAPWFVRQRRQIPLAPFLFQTCRTWLQQHAAFGLKTALATYLAAVCGLHETQLPSILAAATSWHNTGDL